MPIRVIQWATGGVGRAAIEGVLNHPELELVGCLVYSQEKDDVDVGVLLGRDPIGVRATTDTKTILDLDADCAVYAPLVPNESEVAELLRSGKDVVTPVGWVYPAASDTGRLEEACAEGGTTLHGTGIHPGGITERFPLMVSALSATVGHVRAEEYSDIRTYNAPDVIRHIMGFGGTREEALSSPMQQLLSGGFQQSVRMVVDALGFPIDPEIRTVQEVGLATAPIGSPIGTIEPGRVAARHFRWEATVQGVPVVTAAVNWLMGEENLEDGWGFGPEGERFEVDVTGDPPVRLTFKGLHPETVAAGLLRNPGIVATANHCVNAIPYVHRAGPGIKSYLDLPLIVGRAAREIS